MPLPEWAILLFLAGIILLIAELALPTHGLLGVMGVGGILAAVAVCFLIQPWLGAGALLGSAGVTPLAWIWLIKYWPRTRAGRTLILQPTEPRRPEPPIAQIGQTGTTISELRPMGVCEFNGHRIEALSELGMIPPGTPVRVMSMNNRRPIVRPLIDSNERNRKSDGHA